MAPKMAPSKSRISILLNWVLPFLVTVFFLFGDQGTHHFLFASIATLWIGWVYYQGYVHASLSSSISRTYREFERASPVSRYFKQIDGTMIYANPAYREQVEPVLSDSLGNENFVKLLREHELLVFSEHKFHTFSCHVRVNGKPRWMSVVLFPVTDSKHQVYAVGGMLRDATQQKDLQDNFREIQEAINTAALVTITDEEGTILDANENFLKLSEYSREEILGKNHRVLKSGAHDDLFFEKLWSDLRKNGSWIGYIEHRSKSGRLYDVHTLITKLSANSANPLRYIAIRFEVTAQKNLEKQLIEAQSIAKIGSWHFSMATQIPEWTPEMFKILELDEKMPAEERLFHFERIIGKEDTARVIQGMIAAPPGEDLRFEYSGTFDSGARLKHMQCWGRATRDSNGNVIALSGTMRDITQIKVQERQLENERMKSVHTAKLASLGEMSAGIAHEINNPLGVIAGNAPLLKKFKDDPIKFDKKLEDISKAAHRIERIVKSLKKFSRTSDNVPFRHTLLNEIIIDTQVITEAKQKRSNVNVITEIENGLIIFCDAVEIEQVLVNLVNNAIDAVANLPERWVKISAGTLDGHVVLRVTDAGDGISEQVEKKLFEPFFTTKPVGQGTGLGLSISQAILEHHGAKFFLNREYKNTCFEIRFPAPDLRSDVTHVA